MAEKCSATTKTGKPCGSAPVAGSRLCLMHDPASAELRREAGRRGGRNKSNAARAIRGLPDQPLTADELRLVLSGGARDTYLGAMAPGVLNALANASKAMLAVEEFAVLEERLLKIEAAIAAREGVSE